MSSETGLDLPQPIAGEQGLVTETTEIIPRQPKPSKQKAFPLGKLALWRQARKAQRADEFARGSESGQKPPQENRTQVCIGDTPLDLNAIYETPFGRAEMMLPAQTPGGKQIPVTIIANDSTVQVIPYEGHFHFLAYVIPEGSGKNVRNVLTADIRTQAEDGRRLEGFPHAGPLMDAAIDFLDTHRGGPIDEFKAEWKPAESDNFEQYQQGVREKKLKPRKAAFRTWSGRIAQRHGFSHFKGVTPDGSGALEVVFSR